MSLLSSVTKGKIASPVTAVLYSPEGVGKSTFGSKAPGAIFIPTEDGTNELDVSRFPRPKAWTDILAYVDTLEKETHDFKTVVLDTLDGAEPMCWQHVIDAANKGRKESEKYDSIESFGFGKGYVAAVDQWRLLRAGLDRLKAKGMNVILLAHSKVSTFKSPDPAIEPFQRYEMRLNGQACALWKEWPDCLLFANHEILSNKNKEEHRVVGISTGERIMHTVHTAAWDAKNRYSLPERMPLSWTEFEKAVAASRTTAGSALADEIRALIPRLPEQMGAQVESVIARAGGNADQLRKARDFYAAKIA